jgi:NADH-ubiquinone oxidoreductase chain 2
VAMAIPFSKTNQISPIFFQRLTTIILIYAAALSFNALYIQSIGSGIGIYSGFYQISYVSQILDIFIYIIGALILIARPSISSRPEVKYVSPDAEYSLIVMFSTLGSSLLISSNDLISMYLSI